MSQLLQKIQQLQFTERNKAEDLLREFIQTTFPLNVQTVDLRPQAVSLNSFNGFITLVDGNRLFFKTHTEEDNQLDEYYNASMLAEAGYPVIQPLYGSTKAGQHLLIYEVVEAPSVFDVAWDIEQGDSNQDKLGSLTKAQNTADIDLFTLYLNSLENVSNTASAPIHQLFYHRLTQGRCTRFYGDFIDADGKSINLMSGQISMSVVAHKTWSINGQIYSDTLGTIVKRAIRLLTPDVSGISVIGHGDAHNGNVFLENVANKPELLYFDPAFAGRHHPLLDLAKPLFHNVFAMWMYYPDVKNRTTNLIMHLGQNQITVEYNYELPPVRRMFLKSKLEHTLVPLLKHIRQKHLLRDDWRVFLKSALFCCPFLTLNLADKNRFMPKIATLGLAMAIEMGAESHQRRSLIDETLDDVEDALK